MPAFGFDKKDKIKREKPLETPATEFKLYLYALTSIVGHPDSEGVTVGVIANFGKTLRPPFREFLADIDRGGIHLNGTTPYCFPE